MLSLMQNLALCHLWENLEGSGPVPDNLREWFVRAKSDDPGRFFTFLVEPAGKIETYYTLSRSPDDPGAALLEGAEIGSLGNDAAAGLPFNKPSGPRSPQIGPVIKRSYSKAKGAGPTLQILTSTLKSFETIAETDLAWADYFRECHAVFSLPRLIYGGEEFQCDKHAFHEAVQRIPETQTVFLAFKQGGRLPGQVREYKKYLATMLDGDRKYALAKAKPVRLDTCPCCGAKEVRAYSAGLSKAGLNIFNFDREGAFPGITNENAHLSYAVCEHCADLLYVYKFHVNPNYITYLAGQESLMIPELYAEPELLADFIEDYKDYLALLGKMPEKALPMEKKRLVRVLKNGSAVCSIDIIWSKQSLKGQSLSEISGRITDVLPSRLKQMDELNREFMTKASPVFPVHAVEHFDFDLNCSFLFPLLKRPGGKKAANANASQKLLELKRLVVAALYKSGEVPEKRLWEEIMATARRYLMEAMEKERPEADCLYEGFSPRKGASWLTFAGWTRHLARAVFYLHYTEVMRIMKNQRTYTPEMDALKPYFSGESGINSDEKAFAFILGVLFGQVLYYQSRKGVNVNANALTWLKRLTLSGKDLPALYVKIRGKLLAYDAERSETVRAVIREAGVLGNILGDAVSLDTTPCCYFLLMGQSVSSDLFPAKKDKK